MVYEAKCWQGKVNIHFIEGSLNAVCCVKFLVNELESFIE